MLKIYTKHVAMVVRLFQTFLSWLDPFFEILDIVDRIILVGQMSYTGFRKIQFYCEYILRTDKCHIQAVTRFYFIVNMSCGRKNVIYRLSRDSILV
jgi:hypothetical protein